MTHKIVEQLRRVRVEYIHIVSTNFAKALV